MIAVLLFKGGHETRLRRHVQYGLLTRKKAGFLLQVHPDQPVTLEALAGRTERIRAWIDPAIGEESPIVMLTNRTGDGVACIKDSQQPQSKATDALQVLARNKSYNEGDEIFHRSEVLVP